MHLRQVHHVQIATILSDTSKDKNVDTAKAMMRVGEGGNGEKIEVDVMPTIGEEVS